MKVLWKPMIYQALIYDFWRGRLEYTFVVDVSVYTICCLMFKRKEKMVTDKSNVYIIVV